MKNQGRRLAGALFLFGLAARAQTYAEFMKPYQSRMTPISFAPGQKPQLFLALMAIEQSGMVGEDRRDGFGINVDGVSASFLEDSFSRRGGSDGRPTFSSEDMTRLRKLLAHLPNDGGKLPVGKRWLVIQWIDGPEHAVHARLYDGVTPPAIVRELARVARASRISSGFSLPTEGTWTLPPQTEHIAILNDRQLLVVPRQGALQIWNTSPWALAAELSRTGLFGSDAPVREVKVSPDQRIVAVQLEEKLALLEASSWKTIATIPERAGPRPTVFTPDSRHVIPGAALALLDTLRVYDSQNGARVSNAPGLPPQAIAYFPAANGKHAIYHHIDGSVRLWNGKSDLRTLAKASESLQAEFDTGGEHIALTTFSGKTPAGRRTTISRLNESNGAVELQLPEQAHLLPGTHLSADGALLIAPFFDGLNFYSVGIWNAKTGKLQGEAQHCRGPLLPLPNNRLAIPCVGGIVRVWNLTETAAAIQRFEADLAAIE